MNAQEASGLLAAMDRGEETTIRGRKVYRSVVFADRWIVEPHICVGLPHAIEVLTSSRGLGATGAQL